MLRKPNFAKKSRKLKVALITGGPSLERGISLNSARSVLDHLGGEDIAIVPIYLDRRKRAYKISAAGLYSNNPSDFDFKLRRGSLLGLASLLRLLRGADIVFPVMHGAYGEDGGIQSFLEKHRVPFVGSGSGACKLAFDKYEANRFTAAAGFHTLPVALLKIYSRENKRIINDFFKKHKLKKAIVKPATGGSSIGTFAVHSSREALEKANLIFSKRMDTKVVLEPFARGREFTVIVTENRFGLPVALVPTEIEHSLQSGRIFDFRKKYLPTNQVRYHYPARFDRDTIVAIQTKAEQIFKIFNLKDFGRFDGWVLPGGKIWFSDFNTISGMEQNSFLFQQSSRVGFSHGDFLRFILKNSCRRQGINLEAKPSIGLGSLASKPRKPVAVIFGGQTSEKQVSLMSGTNVWLKLRQSKIYRPTAYMQDSRGHIWQLPYAFILNHTVEEITENAERAQNDRKKVEDLEKNIKLRLALAPEDASEEFFVPRRLPLARFIQDNQFIFIALHGGMGEDGQMQKLLREAKKKFNGSGEEVSRICMDKFATGEFIRRLRIPGITIAPQAVYSLSRINSWTDPGDFWEKLKHDLEAKTIIAKPRSDGCSTGVAHLATLVDFKKYFTFTSTGAKYIPAGTLSRQDGIIEMPSEKAQEILFEKYIETDIVSVKGDKLKHIRKTGMVEVTIGLLERNKKLRALPPSITIAQGEVLSLEEKFQGGTGVNLTPPPPAIARPKAVAQAQKLAEILATKLGIKGYARIDAFLNITTGALSIIEVNTLPGLTPSTVLYHEALALEPQMFPREFLETVIKNAGY